MENYSDSDTSSESEYNSSGDSAAASDCSKDEYQDQDLEPEPSEYYDEYRSIPSVAFRQRILAWHRF
jgi:hypothetical protein